MEIIPSRANILTKNFVTYLHRKNCNVNIVKQMILHGADVNYRDSKFNTLLHIVIQHCSEKFSLVRELIIAGIHLNTSNIDDKTALHFCIMYCDDVEVLRELITHGSFVNLRDGDDNSPLHLAVQNNKKSFVDVLIHSSADVDLRNSRGETPLFIAVRNCNLDIVKVLLSSGASVTIVDGTRSNPLHVAIRSPVPNRGILIELMKYGANMYGMDAYMHFPLEYAVLKYYEGLSGNILSIIKILLKCGMLRYDPGKEKWSLFIFLKQYEIYSELSPFLEDCVQEVKRLREEFIHKNFCLFDFLKDGFDCKPMFQKKTLYKELIFNQILHISRNYPVYSDIIAYRLGKSDLGLKSMELYIYTQIESPEGTRRIFLTSDSVFLISQFLSCGDVLNLILAFSNSQHFATQDFGFQNLALGKSTKRKLNGNP